MLEILFQPVALVAWGLLAVVFLSRRAGQRGVRRLYPLSLIVLATYLWFASPLGANIMVGALEADSPATGTCGADTRPVYVVLAGGKRGTPSGETDIARLLEASFRRTVEGARLAQGHPGSLLVLTGGTGSAVTEADLMRHLAITMGVDPATILIERWSETTYESAVGVARLLQPLGVRRLHLVTSAMHMPRAAAVFRRQGFDVCPHPVDSRYLRPDPLEALLPQVTALVKTTDALHEMLGYAWYAMTGRL